MLIFLSKNIHKFRKSIFYIIKKYFKHFSDKLRQFPLNEVFIFYYLNQILNKTLLTKKTQKHYVNI